MTVGPPFWLFAVSVIAIAWLLSAVGLVEERAEIEFVLGLARLNHCTECRMLEDI